MEPLTPVTLELGPGLPILFPEPVAIFLSSRVPETETYLSEPSQAHFNSSKAEQEGAAPHD